MKAKPNQVTIYVSGEFMGNINKYEGTLIVQGTRKYAQYNNAPFVQFVPTRKRIGREIQKGSHPYMLILEGAGHPEPPDMFGKTLPSVPGITVRESKYSSFDARWETDFDQIIDKYLAESGAKVIADYRNTKGFNSHTTALIFPVKEEEVEEQPVEVSKEEPLTIEDIKKQVLKEIGDSGTCVGGMKLKYNGRVVAEQIAQGSLTNYEYFRRVKEFMIKKQGVAASLFSTDEGWMD